jgi:sigma-B regulation protein RsbU (phosphoserine phosphatase)
MSSNFRVLVVDDVLFNIQLLQNILEGMGLSVLTAMNGPDCRRLAEEERPDLILLDIMMPGEDGFETCRILKGTGATADLPVIFISALDDTENKVKGLTMGGWDYICKPFNRAEVQARVTNYLRLQSAYKQVIEEQARRLNQIKDAQQAILVQPSSLPDAKFGVHYIPFNEAGGDFYDVFQISDDRFGYFIADISGHDLGASFATSALKALIRQNSSQLYAPDETIRTINKILLSLFSDGQHLTAVYGILDKKNMTMSLINAAHLPVLYQPREGEPVWIEANSGVIGIFPDVVFTKQVLNVREGDRFFLFTDGLIEAFSGRRMGREEGLARLLPLCAAAREEPCQEAVDSIVATMFADARSHEDDVLLLAFDVSCFRTIATKDGFRAVLPAEFKTIDLVVEKADAFLREQGLTAALFAVNLGCREALTNAVRHGAQGNPQHKVEFELAYTAGTISIKVTDQGPGFDWATVLTHPPPATAESGRGLAIVQGYFDEVQFNRSGNELVLRLRCHQ